MYQYQAEIIKVIDGDTIRADVDLGFSLRQKMVFRIYGINTPEIIGPNAAAGLAAKKAVDDLLPVGKVVTINTHKDEKEKYGRFLADVVLVDETGAAFNLSNYLIEKGFAEVYPKK